MASIPFPHAIPASPQEALLAQGLINNSVAPAEPTQSPFPAKDTPLKPSAILAKKVFLINLFIFIFNEFQINTQYPIGYPNRFVSRHHTI
jgi:hypothetical protein